MSAISTQPHLTDSHQDDFACQPGWDHGTSPATRLRPFRNPEAIGKKVRKRVQKQIVRGRRGSLLQTGVITKQLGLDPLIGRPSN